MLGGVAAAFSVTALCAALAYALRIVSWGGAVGGFALGVAIYLSLGLPGFVILALFVAGGSALTRLGYQSKERRGTAQTRRGAENALANCGVAVACAASAALTPYPEAFAAAFVASLGAAFADTAESEVGQLAGNAPRLLTTLRQVPPGTDGAVSLPGTLAGLAAAGLTTILGLWLGLVMEPEAALRVTLAAFLGTVVDSLLGALTPRLGNEVTNVACTLTAAALAFALA